MNTLLKELKNPFWKDTLIAFQNIQEKTEITTWNEFINQPIWYNKNIKIGNKSLFYEQWFKKKILLISDILDENGIIYSSAELKTKFDLKINFLNHASLHKAIKGAMKNLNIKPGSENPKPIIPSNIVPFCSSKKGTKPMYNILCKGQVIPFGQCKWGKHFVINDYQWKKIYDIPFQCTKSSKLLWLQYRINQFILTTNTTLYKYGKKDTKLCSFCNLEDETIKHLMWDCTKSQELLSIFENHCLDNSAHYATNSFTFLLGNLAPDAKEENIISMVIKSYIYRKRCLNETLTIQGLLSDIRTHLTTVKYLDTKKGKYENFNRKWEKWLFFLK